MGRKICTTLPVLDLPKILNPQLPNKFQLQAKEKAIKDRQRRNFNSCHCAKDLQPLEKGEKVWIRDNEEQAVVTDALPKFNSVAL